VKVTSPDGSRWKVRRRWLPWRRRLKGGWDVPFVGGGDDPLSVILLVLVGIPAAIIFVLWSLELAVVLVLAPFALLARAWFGRHWHVETYRARRFVAQHESGSFDESGALVDELAEQIRAGRYHPPAR